VPHAPIRAQVDAHRQPHSEVVPSRLAHRRPSRRYGGRRFVIRTTYRARIGAVPHDLWTASVGARAHAPEGLPTRLGALLASRMLRQYLVGASKRLHSVQNSKVVTADRRPKPWRYLQHK
jgi:hypothetical protein